VNLIAPPASPGNYLLLRCSLSAAHTDADVAGITHAFHWLADNFGDSVFHL
jgi:8-amino-7-oxononanoate synthase